MQREWKPHRGNWSIVECPLMEFEYNGDVIGRAIKHRETIINRRIYLGMPVQAYSIRVP